MKKISLPLVYKHTSGILKKSNGITHEDNWEPLGVLMPNGIVVEIKPRVISWVEAQHNLGKTMATPTDMVEAWTEENRLGFDQIAKELSAPAFDECSIPVTQIPENQEGMSDQLRRRSGGFFLPHSCDVGYGNKYAINRRFPKRLAWRPECEL